MGKDQKAGSGEKYVAGMSEAELRDKYSIDEIVKIGSNENPIGPSKNAVAAMIEAAENSHRYPPMTDDGLRIALASAIGSPVTPDHIVTGNGACEVLTMIGDSHLDQSNECIICRPTFPIYEFVARRNNSTVKYADLLTPSFTYDVAGIIKAVTKNTRVLFLCSPNNPTGTLLSVEELNTLIERIPEETLIILDEVYHHFVEEDRRADSIGLATSKPNVIVVHSFSKAYGLAGGRLGYGVARPETIDIIKTRRLPFHLNNLTIEAALAALEDTAHIAETVSMVASGRTWLQEQLDEMGVKTWPSSANFILFQTSVDASVLYDRLLRRGVIVRPLDNFYLPKHLRVTVGNPSENAKFIEALQESLQEQL